jgi:hypothetical protein
MKQGGMKRGISTANLSLFFNFYSFFLIKKKQKIKTGNSPKNLNFSLKFLNSSGKFDYVCGVYLLPPLKHWKFFNELKSNFLNGSVSEVV